MSVPGSRYAAAAALCLAALAPAQAPDRAESAVREFERFFPRYDTVEEQIAAVQTLELVECPAAVEALLEVLEHRDWRVRAAAVDVAASYTDPASFAPMVARLGELSSDLRRARWVEVLGRARVASALPALIEIGLSESSSSALRFETARALGRLGAPEARPALEVLLADAEPDVQIAACDAIAKLDLRELAPEILPLLEHRAWQVRSAAIHALGALRAALAVEPLIEVMREGGRLQQDCADALVEITTLDFGVDADRWAERWQAMTAIGWRIPTDAELERARAAGAAAALRYHRSDGPSTFAGIETTSERVLFVIDVSGSMDDVVVETERFPNAEDYRKLTIAKAELERAVKALEPRTFFNIVAFATDVMPWKRHLVPANIVNKSSAVDWVDRLEPIGGRESQGLAAAGLFGAANLAAGETNTHKALLYAFGIDPTEPRSRSRPRATGIDTVFFLSDGRPSTGVLVDTREILAAVRKHNETARIVFHAIAIGDFQRSFLRDLAQQSGGVFVNLGQ